MLAVVGGHSFQDYQAYRDEVLGSLDSHGLRLGDDMVLVGTVPDVELPGMVRRRRQLRVPVDQ